MDEDFDETILDNEVKFKKRFKEINRPNRPNAFIDKSLWEINDVPQPAERTDTLMRQIKTFSDERYEYNCSYCGGETGTRDHIPSKVFLDEPYPENLPVVPACDICNQDFSLHEEYIACLIESAKGGTTEIDKLKREKIKRIFKQKPLLQKRIEESKFEENGIIYFKAEEERLRKVIVKLVKGHAKFEYSQPQFEEPQHLWANALGSLTQEQLNDFLSVKKSAIDKVPEIGSRAFHRVLISEQFIVQEKWIEVQERNYSYLTEDLGDSIRVKLIIRMFLAVEAIWTN